MLRVLILIWGGLFVFGKANAQKDEASTVISQLEVNRLITTLASDEMSGRDPNHEGGDLAAEFIAQEFEKMGLKPYGEQEDYFQKFMRGKREYKNVLAMIPGKSKPEEFVIFSAHYDHIGILRPVRGDSIANGADDDASGVTAILCLAKYFQTLQNNERSLLFIAFTAEEQGLVGSKYFAENLDKPGKFVAGINVEMIGKIARAGEKTAFVTGFRKTTLPKILQAASPEGFKFTPDPYPFQNLFYRSDNASLANYAIPAHTISSVQIDRDQYYHTVDDEVETLNLSNMREIILGLAEAVMPLVKGEAKPEWLRR